ncbi:MAG TPA: hypothetical protein VFK82_08215, partial [Burkholderiaceae bacterium]|nr:hypothetical protein [Burkholderiaceae bacterium]
MTSYFSARRAMLPCAIVCLTVLAACSLPGRPAATPAAAQSAAASTTRTLTLLALNDLHGHLQT